MFIYIYRMSTNFSCPGTRTTCTAICWTLPGSVARPPIATYIYMNIHIHIYTYLSIYIRFQPVSCAQVQVRPAQRFAGHFQEASRARLLRPRSLA